ncbi:MAG: SPOR domain-containing protein [Proteobacteria bacterium]|nr:SPOR domain-containing protein [Pseudomonadota bacterium]
MKLLFSGLLLANLGMWMWGNWYVTGPVAPAALQARAEISPEKMATLAEINVSKLKRRQSPVASPRKLTDVTPPRMCYRIGPFSHERDLRPVRKWLADYVVSAVPQEKEEEITSYRVYIKPLASARKAAAMRKRLTRAGFKDHALLREQGMKNAISLGVFSVKKNALTQIRRLRKKGFKASRQTLVRYQTEYFIDIKAENDLRTVLSKRRWKTAKAKTVACEVAKR